MLLHIIGLLALVAGLLQGIGVYFIVGNIYIVAGAFMEKMESWDGEPEV